MRALLVGAGEVGRKHLAALNEVDNITLAGIVEPGPLPGGLAVDVPMFAEHHLALAAVQPELVIVAAPPGISLVLARQAAGAGAAVLVEKPVVIDPADLAPDPMDERIFVGFQTHFAPGLAELFTTPPEVVRVEVVLSCRRDAGYYRGWRAGWASAGGILHQQAIHGLALALRLLPSSPVFSCEATVEHQRRFGDAEDTVCSAISFVNGRDLVIHGRVDSEGVPRHHVSLHCADGATLTVAGRNLEAGLGGPTAALTNEDLRVSMYGALVEHAQGGPTHPCLFPLAELYGVLEVITHVYQVAGHHVRPAA